MNDFSNKIVFVNVDEFDRGKFTKPIGNVGNNKPIEGGLFTFPASSIINNKMTPDYYELFINKGENKLNIYMADISEKARVLTMNSQDDYMKSLDNYGIVFDSKRHPASDLITINRVLSLEELKENFDCVWLTDMGAALNYDSFHGWGCEAMLLLNVDILSNIHKVNQLSY